MELTLIILLVVLGCFSFVLWVGAPYLPTHSQQAEQALDKLNLRPGDTLYELGCGDGKVLLMAARRGVKSVGWELNPILFLWALIRTRRYRELITIKFGNFWNADLTQADAVYVFLLDRFMPRLDKKLTSELKHGTRVASYTFKIPGKKALSQDSAVFIYEY